MKIIDEKDRKILLELDKNARQTDSEIAHKVRISKQVANTRIKKLEEKEIITNYYTVLNVGALGYNSQYLFLQLQGINAQKEKEILQKIKALDYVGWLVSGVGRWDAILLIFAKSVEEFERYLHNILELYGNYIHEYEFATLLRAEHIGYQTLGGNNKKELSQTEKETSVKISEKEEKIIATIAQHARLPITEIAERVHMPAHVASYQLKKLVKENIIQGFKPKIDINKLGYQWHMLLIQTPTISNDRKQELIQYCKKQKEVYYVTQTIGKYNFFIDIHVRDILEFKQVLLNLKERFADIIKLYESIVIFEEYKINYLPNKSH